MNTWFYIQIASKLSYHLMFFFTLYKTWQYHKVAQEHIRPSEQDWKKEKNILEEQTAQELRMLSRSLADCKSLALNAVVDLNDGKIFTTMEGLMVFVKVPL